MSHCLTQRNSNFEILKNPSSKHNSFMSLFQLPGVGDTTSYQLTTTVTPFSNFAHSIQIKVRVCIANVLKIGRTVLYYALQRFPKKTVLCSSWLSVLPSVHIDYLDSYWMDYLKKYGN